jgi:hypothetical protein
VTISGSAPGRRYARPPPAPWRSGYAAACKAVYTGSIPVGASSRRAKSGAHRGEACPEGVPDSLEAAARHARSKWASRSAALRAPSPSYPSEPMKRCTKCSEVKPLAEFSRDRSRRDGRAPWCRRCVRRWQQEHAEHLAEYHRRWQRANRDKTRAQNRRYRERKRQDPDYRERRRAQDRRYRERKRARLSDTHPRNPTS